MKLDNGKISSCIVTYFTCKYHTNTVPLSLVFKMSRSDLSNNDVFSDCLKYADTVGRMLEADRYDTSMDLLTQLSAYRFLEDGYWRVWVYSWGRDCDLMEADHIYTIPATIDSYHEYEDMVYDNAEGPSSFCMISEQDAEEYEPYWRDIAAEQMGY